MSTNTHPVGTPVKVPYGRWTLTGTVTESNPDQDWAMVKLHASALHRDGTWGTLSICGRNVPFAHQDMVRVEGVTLSK